VLNLEDKKSLVAEVTARAQNALSLVGAEYSRIPAVKMTEIRKQAREASVDLLVVRNTLARRALAATEFACITDLLVGPLLLAFSNEDPGAAARILREHIKANVPLVVRVVALPGQALKASDLETLASLPTRLQAIAMLAGVTQAPVTKLVRTTAEIYAKMVRVVDAVRIEKEKQAA
jgi:large subunit ribosomal protein L10